jgi:hypothetical protein
VSLELDDTFNDQTALLSAIQMAGKYVALNLSACYYSWMPATFDPGTAITGKSKIVSLVLPNEATAVKAGPITSHFTNFTALTSISGSGITDIITEDEYRGAFYQCAALTTVDFPKTETICNSALYNCSLTTVNLPKAASIGAYVLDQWPGVIRPLTITLNVTVRVPVGASGYDSTWQTGFQSGNNNIMLTIQYQ